MNKQTYAEPWKQIADTWQKFSVGARPSPKNIQDMEEFLLVAIQKKNDVRALVYGSTPEIRDMLAAHKNISVTVLDASKEMYQAMTSLMANNTDQETFVEGDWLTTDLGEHTFDASFGDFTKGNVTYEKQYTLYEQTARRLKQDGVHIERISSRFEHTQVHDEQAVLDKFSKIAPTTAPAEQLMWELIFLTHHNTICTTDRVFEVLQTHKHLPHMLEYLAIISELISPGKSWDYGRGWGEEKKPIEAYFDILEKRKDDTMFADWAYVFAMRPKSKNFMTRVPYICPL